MLGVSLQNLDARDNTLVFPEAVRNLDYIVLFLKHSQPGPIRGKCFFFVTSGVINKVWFQLSKKKK